MNIWIDLIAILIILISTGIAYYRGFVKTFFGFISAILALILACALCKPVALKIKESTEIDEWIIESIVSLGNGEQSGDLQDEKYNMAAVGTKLDEDYNEAIVGAEEYDSLDETSDKSQNDFLSLIDNLPDMIADSFNYEEKKAETYEKVAIAISDTVINILSWIIIYTVVRIVLAILTFIFDGIMNIPVLKTINNVAGLAIGVFMGIFRIYVILAIIYFASNLFDISFIVTSIKASTVVSHMYNSNLLINLIF